MKVLQINSVCAYGSTGRIVINLYNELKKNNDDCVIAYGRGKAPQNIKTIKIGNKIDQYIHVFMTRLFDLHGFFSIKATKELIKKIEEYNPDIIHLHNLHGYYINIDKLFKYLAKLDKKIVWTLHDCWAFTGHCSHFDYINCNKWKSKCYKCPQKREYPKSVFISNSKKNYLRKKELFTSIKDMTIVVPSNWLGKLVKQSFLGKYDIKVINNGIDLEKFKPTTSNFRKKYNLDDKFIILGVANVWNSKKGIDTFIELSKRLDNTFKIVLVGIDKKKNKNLPSNIIGIERTNNIEELTEIYTVADVFVNPTLEDTFPTTNIESLACGTPVITYNTGGSVEIIDKNTGIDVEKNKIEELIKKITFLKNNNIFRKSDCIERSKRYDSELKYKEYIKLYKNIERKETL